MKKPNCYKCKWRGELIGDYHSKCNNKNTKVEGSQTGIKGGWFNYPFNFDPLWLEECDGFEKK